MTTVEFDPCGARNFGKKRVRRFNHMSGFLVLKLLLADDAFRWTDELLEFFELLVEAIWDKLSDLH